MDSESEAVRSIPGKGLKMLCAIFSMLLIFGAVGLLASYTLVGGVIQILLISALVALGI